MRSRAATSGIEAVRRHLRAVAPSLTLQICNPVRLVQNRMGFDRRAVPTSTLARATVFLVAPGEGPASRMLVGDTPASHQDAPEAKADADRASSVAADPPGAFAPRRGGGSPISLASRLAGSTLVNICTSLMRLSHPPRGRRCARCSRRSPPICPRGLKSPRRAGVGRRAVMAVAAEIRLLRPKSI